MPLCITHLAVPSNQQSYHALLPFISQYDWMPQAFPAVQNGSEDMRTWVSYGFGYLWVSSICPPLVTILIPLCHRVSQLDPPSILRCCRKSTTGTSPSRTDLQQRNQRIQCRLRSLKLGGAEHAINIWIYFITFSVFCQTWGYAPIHGSCKAGIHMRKPLHLTKDSEHVFCPRAFWSKPIDGSEEVGRQSKSICAFTSKSRRVSWRWWRPVASVPHIFYNHEEPEEE